MFVQTQKTPNPDSLKFLPGKKVSESGPYEILNKNETDNDLIRNILSISGVTGIFLGEDFLSVNKKEKEKWEDIKHIVISHINMTLVLKDNPAASSAPEPLRLKNIFPAKQRRSRHLYKPAGTLIKRSGDC